MVKRTIAFRSLALALLLGSAAALGTALSHARNGTGKPAHTAAPFHLVITGPTAGTLKPCGCAAGMLGGLSRRPVLLQALAAEPGTIVLDCGDLVAPPRLEFQTGRPLAQAIKLNLVLRALSAMPYSAYCLGERDLVLAPFEDDLVLGAPFDEELHGLANVGQLLFDKPPVLTNVRCEGFELWVPHREILDPFGRRVVITSVIQSDSPDWSQEYIHEEPAPSLRRLIAEQSQAGAPDLVVCIFHGETMEQARELARAVDGIGLIVFADTERYDDASVPMRRENGAVIVRPGDRGRNIVELTLSREGNQSELLTIASHNVDETSVADPTLKSLTQEYRQRSAAHSPPLVEAYAGLEIPPGSELYVGSQTCQRCHEREYEIWKESKHAHAYETLEKDDAAHLDPACVYCHTVGYGWKLAFGDPRLESLQARMAWRSELPLTEALKGVGCENCHGPGLRHSLRPAGTGKIAMVVHKDEYKSCGKCHDAENSPHFRYETYWEKIKH